MAYPTTACGESRLIWKGRVTPGTPDELPDFWESAANAQRAGKRPMVWAIRRMDLPSRRRRPPWRLPLHCGRVFEGIAAGEAKIIIISPPPRSARWRRRVPRSAAARPRFRLRLRRGRRLHAVRALSAPGEEAWRLRGAALTAALANAVAAGRRPRRCRRVPSRALDHPIHGPDVVVFLRHLQRYHPGQLMVIWDRLQVHRSADVKGYRARHPEIMVEELPTYAPDLNPEEGCHGDVKGHLLNATPEDTRQIRKQANRGFAPLRRRPDLILAFFHHADY